jgi:hypothetical protein
MSDSRPGQLIRAKDLMDNGKVEEALEIIIDFEKIRELTPKNHLSALILRGNIYRINHQFKKVVIKNNHNEIISLLLNLEDYRNLVRFLE